MYMLMYNVDMSKRYSIAEARANLPTIVDEVEAGTEIELTRRGKPVAVVISRREYERLHSERPQFTEAYRNFLQKFRLDEVGLDDGFFESIREASSGREVNL
jgi:prevent-host-death family protein